MRHSLGLLAVLVGLQASPALAAECSFQPFTTVPGADVGLMWSAKSGHPCTLLLKVSSRIDNVSMTVARQATHGKAATPTVTTISYVSRPGFVGRDSFVIERTAEAMARFVTRGTAHWTINVNVVP